MRKLSSFTKNDNLTIKTTTIMTQIKLFEDQDRSHVEELVNNFLQVNADSIKVIDIKHAIYIPSEGLVCKWTAMVIYETL